MTSQLVEEKQTASVNLNLEERKLELDKLAKKWREIEVSGREVPEALKPRKIDIKHGGVASLTDKAKKLIGGDDKAAA